MLTLKLVTVTRAAYEKALTYALTAINKRDVEALNQLDDALLHANTLDGAATRMCKDAERIRDDAHSAYGKTCCQVTADYNSILNQLDAIKGE